MFARAYVRWITGIAFSLLLAGALVGAGSASAQTLTAQAITNPDSSLSPQYEQFRRPAPQPHRPESHLLTISLTYSAGEQLAPGSSFTYTIAVQDAGSEDATNTVVTLPLDPNVVVDGFTSSRDGVSVQSLTSESIILALGKVGAQTTTTMKISAHLLPTAPETLSFACRAHVSWDDHIGKGQGSTSTVLYMEAGRMPISGTEDNERLDILGAGGPVDAGTTFTVVGTSYGTNEEISFWINVPDGVAIPDSSLGQDDSHLQGSVVGLDRLAQTGVDGKFTYSLHTDGLPAGTYSLVAQGQSSGSVGVASFTIK